ncbi:MAG TPA: hypothetical protein VH251_09020 [Verrucomicrobiae bacterium]|nr:hypothetical protein [Verrucomicrobiae bacterium]
MGYLILAAIAAIGFVASVACHLMGWLHIQPPGGQWAFLLHVGIFVVWIPLVISANRTMPKPNQGRGNLEHLSALLPKWVRIATGVLFGYAILDFLYFIYCTSQYPKNGVPFYIELRGFSGHWMMFYGVATAGFVALARLKQRQGEKDTFG